MGRHDDDVLSVLELTARQHGAISLGQLRALGCTRAGLRRLVDVGVLERLGPRVYGAVGAAPTFERHAHAALLSLGPRAVVSHRAAAHLHGLVHVAEPEFTVPRSRRNAVCRFVVHATDALGEHDRTFVDGLACTTVTRTLLDLASADLSPTQLTAIAARVDRRQLHGLHTRRTGSAPAARRVAAALAAVDAERHFLAALRRAGVPIPDRTASTPRPTFHFPAYDITIALGPTATDWPAIADATRRALIDAGWPTRPHTARPAA